MSSPAREYVDVRSLLPDYHRDVCPDCGQPRWFQERDWDGQPAWVCRECSNPKHQPLEIPCPDCETRMVGEGDAWVCRVCETRVERDREALIDRLTGTYEVPGYDRGAFGPCPLCETRHAVRCGPDGERTCDECDELYLARFSDDWFAYAVWLESPESVRVRG